MTQGNAAIIYAYHIKGYRATKDGEVIGVNGRHLKASSRGYGYRKFNVSILTEEGRKSVPISVHRLQAYQKFGEEIFNPDIMVRHLDGNPINNSVDNLELGNPSENMMDKSEVARKEQSMMAAKAIGSNMKSVYHQVFRDRKSGMTFNQLNSKYGISKGTLSRYFGNSKNPVSKEYRDFISKIANT